MPKALSAKAKVERDRAIVHDRARGFTWRTIASRHNVSERMAQRIWQEGLDRTWEEPSDPIDTAAELLAIFDASVEEAADLAAATRNESVRLGAIKFRHELLVAKLELMRVLGLLPRDLLWLRHEIDYAVILQAAGEAFFRNDIPEEATRQYVDAISGCRRMSVAKMKFAEKGVGKPRARRTPAVANGNG